MSSTQGSGLPDEAVQAAAAAICGLNGWGPHYGGEHREMALRALTAGAPILTQRLEAHIAALLEVIATKATLVPGPTGHPYNLGAEQKVWACWGPWTAGGGSVDEAHAALRAEIRRDLSENVGAGD